MVYNSVSAFDVLNTHNPLINKDLNFFIHSGYVPFSRTY
jgi:hypothetical protein